MTPSNIMAWTLVVLAEGLLLTVAALITFVHGAPPRRPDLATPPPPGLTPPPGCRTEYGAYLQMAGSLLKPDLLIDLKRPVSPNVMQVKEVEFGQADGVSLRLDLYRPRIQREAVPGLVFLHFGGWDGGRRQDLHHYADLFASKGYVTATVDYRLSGVSDFPAPVEDAKCAVRWMRAQAAELHVDPDRIAVIGNSAGGHLALLVGLTAGNAALEGGGGHPEQRSDVQAVVSLYAPANLAVEESSERRHVQMLMGIPFAQAPERYRLASPVHQVHPGAPPVLVMHGTTDSLVPVTESDQLVEQLQKHGVRHAYHRLDGWPHGMDLARVMNDYVVAVVEDFLARELGGPAGSALSAGSGQGA